MSTVNAAGREKIVNYPEKAGLLIKKNDEFIEKNDVLLQDKSLISNRKLEVMIN
jgi:hypothetical protein